MAETALLVIDVQQSFQQRANYQAALAAPFFSRINRLIDGFARKQLPIVQIFHVEPSGVFARASGFVTTMPEVQIRPTVCFDKTVHSALCGTGLSAWLTTQGISRLVVSGIRSEQCCETTTRHASDSGYAVDYVSEATLTFAMTHPNGRHYSAEEIRERTELVLADRFASLCDVERAVERAH